MLVGVCVLVGVGGTGVFVGVLVGGDVLVRVGGIGVLVGGDVLVRVGGIGVLVGVLVSLGVLVIVGVLVGGLGV